MPPRPKHGAHVHEKRALQNLGDCKGQTLTAENRSRPEIRGEGNAWCGPSRVHARCEPSRGMLTLQLIIVQPKTDQRRKLS